VTDVVATLHNEVVHEPEHKRRTHCAGDDERTEGPVDAHIRQASQRPDLDHDDDKRHARSADRHRGTHVRETVSGRNRQMQENDCGQRVLGEERLHAP
jgi:hypothetical protein